MSNSQTESWDVSTDVRIRETSFSMNLMCPSRKLNHQMLTWKVEFEIHILAMDGRGKYNCDWLTVKELRKQQDTSVMVFDLNLIAVKQL